MIPGDIDLTKNLDFRKTIRRELPKLPTKWNDNNIIINNYSDISVTSTTISSNTIIHTYSNWTDDYNTTPYYSYWNYDNTFTMLYDYNNLIDDYNPFTIQYDNYWMDYYDREYTMEDYNHLSQTNTISSKYLFKNEPVKDVFGNIIKEEKPIEQICWQNRQLSNNNKIKYIPWISNNHRNFNSYWHHHDKYNNIPWGIENNHGSKKESIADKICYLADKSIKFINDYLNKDEEDLSSYLTNMNWIRVKDAVID